MPDGAIAQAVTDALLPMATALGGAVAAVVAVFVKRGLFAAKAALRDALNEDAKEEAAELVPERSDVLHHNPCEAHLLLEKDFDAVRADFDKFSVTLERISESIDRRDEKFEKSILDVFHRIENSDCTIVTMLQRQSDIIQSVGDIKTDMAFLKAKIDREHAEEHIVPVIESVLKNEHLLLFIDDHIDSLLAITTMLEQAGFHITKAKTYEEGMNAFEAVPFKYAIIDASLSKGAYDGVQLAEWAKQNHPEIEIVIYSGYDLKMVPARCHYIDKRDYALLIETMVRLKKEAEAEAYKEMKNGRQSVGSSR